MSSWLEGVAQSHKVQLVITALASGAIVASAIVGLQTAKRQYRVSDLKSSIPSLDDHEHDVGKINGYGGGSLPLTRQENEDARSAALAARAQAGDYDEELILEQLARNRVFLGEGGLAALRSAFVVVVGCGGVGSHAAAALARSGVGRLRLVDFDQVTLSSLNRHAVATLADVGTPKVACLRKRLAQVVPWARVDARNELFGAAHADRLLGPWQGSGGAEQQPDFVLDAIDNIDSKVELLAYCHEHSLPVISSMGAGCKSDPTRVYVGDISATNEDALSKSTRRRLRARGVGEGIACVYSQEKPGPGKATLQPLAEAEVAKGGVGELGVLPDFRVRILPVLGTMPAVFGLAAANHVMLSLTAYPHDYLPTKGRPKMYDAVLAGLQGSEERVARHYGVDAQGLRLAFSVDDVGYLIEEVWHGRSVVSGLASRMALVRWERPVAGAAFVDSSSVPGQKRDALRFEDVVLMTKDEALRHEKEVLKGDKALADLYGRDVFEIIEKRRQEERYYARYR